MADLRFHFSVIVMSVGCKISVEIIYKNKFVSVLKFIFHFTMRNADKISR